MIKTLLLCASLVGLAGCYSQVIVDSDPQGATVTLDGEAKGKTPVTLDIDPVGMKYSYKLDVSLQGYDSESQMIRLYQTFWGPRWPDRVFVRLRRTSK